MKKKGAIYFNVNPNVSYVKGTTKHRLDNLLLACREKGIEIDNKNIYIDNCSFDMPKLELRKMLNSAGKKNFDVLLIYDYRDLTRKIYELYKIYLHLKEKNIKLEHYKEHDIEAITFNKKSKI